MTTTKELQLVSVLVYFVRDYGGAFDAMKYALKKKKYVIKV